MNNCETDISFQLDVEGRNEQFTYET
jgi:hypothetical protein